MRRALSTLILLALAIPLVLVGPTAGFAAANFPVWETVEVTLHSEDGSSVLLISGKLPDATKLPVTVQLAAPAGAKLQWAGEILNGPASEDPTVKYEIATVGDSDVYTFTLTQSRTGQIEVTSPGVLRFDGTGYIAAVKWAPSSPVKQVNLNVLIPPNGQVSTADEGLQTVPAGSGYSYLRKVAKDPKLGEPITINVNYTLSAVAPGAGAPQTNSSFPVVLLALLFGFGGLIAVLAIRNKTRARAAASPVDDDEDVLLSVDDELVEDAPTVRHAPAPAPPHAPVQPGKPRNTKLVPLVVMAVIVFAGAFAVSIGNRSVATGDIVSMQFATVDECASSEFLLQPKGNASLRDDAQKVLTALRAVAGIGSATVDLKASTVTVSYCGSVANSDQILAALQATGYTVTPAGFAPVVE